MGSYLAARDEGLAFCTSRSFLPAKTLSATRLTDGTVASEVRSEKNTYMYSPWLLVARHLPPHHLSITFIPSAQHRVLGPYGYTGTSTRPSDSNMQNSRFQCNFSKVPAQADWQQRPPNPALDLCPTLPTQADSGAEEQRTGNLQDLPAPFSRAWKQVLFGKDLTSSTKNIQAICS